MTKKNKIYLIIASLLGFLVLGYQISKISFQTFLNELSDIKMGWIAVAVICMLLRWVFEAVIL